MAFFIDTFTLAAYVVPSFLSADFGRGEREGDEGWRERTAGGDGLGVFLAESVAKVVLVDAVELVGGRELH